jgi:hypothetical protein
MKNLTFSFLFTTLYFIFSNFANSQNISPYFSNKKLTDSKKYKFELSGIANSTASMANQSSEYSDKILPDKISKNHQNNSINIGLDNQIFAKTLLKISSENYLGATAKFELNYNSNSRYQNPNLDQIFIYTENNFGKFEFGNIVAVNQKMKFGPAKFARGAGGINGKYLEYVNLPMLAKDNNLCGDNILNPNCQNLKNPRFILLAQSPIGHGGYAKGFYPRDIDNKYNSSNYNNFNKYNFRSIKDDSFEGIEDSLKINFYSPKINDFQFGFSFAPNSQNQGFTANTAPDSRDTKLKNIFSFASNYSHDFDNLNLSLSSSLEMANSKAIDGIARNNLRAIDFGASMSYFGFTIGGSYGNWGKSLYAKSGIYSCEYDYSKNLISQNCSNSSKNFSDSYYYTTGIGYEIGPIKTSLTSINSNFQKNKYRAISFGIDYKLKKYLTTYFEITNFHLTNQQIYVANSLNNIQNNSGNILLTGFYYIF